VGRIAAEAVVSWPLEFDVSAVAPSGAARLGGWVCAPAQFDPSRPAVVLACLAGGTCSTRYFDLDAEDVPDSSMARYLAARGFVVMAFDHLGLGLSTAVDDIFLVTPSVAAAAQDCAVRTAFAELRAGTLAPGLPPMGEFRMVGVGHSMGGMIVGVQQARHATFDAVAVLGHGGDGLPDVLTPHELALDVERPYPLVEADITALARTRFGSDSTVEGRRAVPGSFMLADVPDAVRRAFVAQQVPLAFACGLTSMIPGATDEAKAAISVPVFLAFGDHDLTANYFGSLARYRAGTDATLFVLPGSAHCHNQATTRTLLWDRFAAWARTGSEDGSP
jgi:pimeloyl-ACP methyl ester carboxylesterase